MTYSKGGIGGEGGPIVVSPGQFTGGAGAAALNGTVSGTSTGGGNVIVQATLIGGDGGVGLSGA